MTHIYSLNRLFIILILLGNNFFVSAQNISLEEDRLVDRLSQPNIWADSILSTLSDEERIAQLFMIAAYSNKGNEESERIAGLVSKYQIGGIIFFQGEPGKQAELTNKYQGMAKVPLWIGMDAEIGLGARLKQTISYPRQIMLGAIQDNELIFQLGKQIGKECNRLGVHVNFSPVMDVNNNPKNPVINSRSFGEDRCNVTNKSYAFASGMQKSGIIAVGKHFPGHGDTETDSHFDLPLVDYPIERIDSIELFPFRSLINNGLGGIMVSHLNVPALDSLQKVATLSRPIVSQLLKDEMGFNGLIFTDALNMQGVRKFYPKGVVDAKALIAGNDVLLFTEDVAIAIKEIKLALKRGEISWDDINRKCLKVLKAKHWLILNKYKPIDQNKLWSGLNTQQGFILRRRLAEKAITLVKNDDQLLPLKRLDTLKIASVAMGVPIRNRFQEYLSRYSDIDFFQIGKNASIESYYQLLKKLDKYNLVIVSKHDSDLRASKKFGITSQTIEFLSELSKSKKVVFDLFANPYGLDLYEGTDRLKGILVSYEDNIETQMASAQIIFGGLASQGRLPVTVNGHFPVGTGFETQHNRLGFSLPEQAGLNTLKLNVIDSIVNDAIKKKASPGCQILIARKGKVVFHKSYGHHTYNDNVEVRNPDIYDLASLTKITATLPALMQLCDEGWINVDHALGEYFSKAKGTNKDTLILKKILAHESRLLSYKPFHWEAVDSASFDGDLFSRTYSKRYSLKMADKLYLDRNYRFRKGIFSNQNSEEYPVQIANNLFIRKGYHDTIINQILATEYRESNGYKYSDLGFIMMGEMVKEISGECLESYVKRHLYDMLGASSLGYHPLKRFSADRIVPTQDDKFFRKQWLKAYVHDPTAAMLGGVSGHAGMFGNAGDLAKLAQMYLQEGTYGGETYISAETMNRFTARAYPDSENRRGIGFDKPFYDTDERGGPTCSEASDLSYGHTGFTGTMIWIDPKYNLLYIFLSNRICPDESNTKLMEMDVRTKIQEQIYKSIIKDEKADPEFKSLPFSPFGKGMFY
ncbi:glycoside hydrolase family 3 N-terminal domain-containing protein [Labilibaculum sp.]|uniref:glycoside hydrolase family 3 N-terminal domain-containing protein n=1 Tax=Labilibaculum sp. TaxID=2060723 RepID=UPI002AA7BFF6|nr:glycoside hydrolase family 3 N-terminal domain-containing protein [Labilibaculum sp.]